MAARQPGKKPRLAIALPIIAGRTPALHGSERGKRNGDGGDPQFIGVPIDNLVRDGLEEHP